MCLFIILLLFVLLGSGLVLYLPSLSTIVGRRGFVKDVHFDTGLAWMVAIGSACKHPVQEPPPAKPPASEAPIAAPRPAPPASEQAEQAPRASRRDWRCSFHQ